MTDKTITAIIVDDEQESLDILEESLSDFPEIEIVGKAMNADNAIESILKFRPDVIFLDIQMPGKNGFEVVKEIKKYKYSPCIIFVTAYDKYAIKAIKYAAFDFLLKPIDPNELAETISRFKSEGSGGNFQKRIEQLLLDIKKNQKIRFNTRTGFILLNTADIIYCESDRNYSIIYLGNEKKVVVTCNLHALEQLLPSDNFFRISRFVVVNLDYLTSIDRKKHTCLLEKDDEIFSFSITRKKIKEFEKTAS
ncbi:MAG: response regulator transcription factor [Bacteroidales bacterium]|nr:response regulator transcription factor [Bacteroidales bacterium]